MSSSSGFGAVSPATDRVALFSAAFGEDQGRYLLAVSNGEFLENAIPIGLVGGDRVLGIPLADLRAAHGVEVDVLTADLRHHPAAEFAEKGGPALVDVAHWAAEWTWLPVVEQRLRAALGDAVETRVSTVVTDPWTMHL